MATNGRTRIYIGLDLHKRYSTVCEKDTRGRTLRELQVDNTTELQNYAGSLGPHCSVAVEATGNWYYLYETIESSGAEVALCHPLKTKAIASARIMTDKISADILADLLRTSMLPRAYIPDRSTRDLRETLRYRASLVAMRTRVKCKLRAILSKNGLICPYSDIMGPSGIRFLESVEIRECYRQEIDGYVRLGRQLNEEVCRIEATIEEEAKRDERAQLLDTIPGVGAYTALLILAEVGDIGRFPSAGHLASYAGLVPSVHASGGKTHLGHITKQGSKWLRWILVECWWKLIQKSPAFARHYGRICARHGSKAARVAVARKLVHVIYRMLKHNEPFRETTEPVSS